MSSSTTLIAIGSVEYEQARSIEYYNPELNEWSELVNIDVEERTQYKSILLEGKLMLVGGYLDGVVSTVQSYDFATETLTYVSPMIIERLNHELAVVNGQMYAIAGLSVPDLYLTSVERYDPSNNEWTDVKPLPTGRFGIGVAVQNSEIYVIGGFNEDQLSVVEAYNPALDTWRTCAPMNEKRNMPAVASVDNFIYAVGGYDGYHRLESAEIYDPTIDSWTFIRDMTIPRNACGCANYDNTLVVAGGSDIDYYTLVESYSNYQWTTVAPLLTARAYFSLVEIPWSYIKKSRKCKL